MGWGGQLPWPTSNLTATAFLPDSRARMRGRKQEETWKRSKQKSEKAEHFKTFKQEAASFNFSPQNTDAVLLNSLLFLNGCVLKLGTGVSGVFTSICASLRTAWSKKASNAVS